MRKFANITGTAMAGIGGLSISVLVLLAQWAIVQDQWVQILNPFLWLMTMIVALTWPVTWAAIAMVVVGLVVASKAEPVH